MKYLNCVMVQKLIHPADDNYNGLATQLGKLTDLLIHQTQAIYNAKEEINDNESILESKLFRFTLSNKSFIKLMIEPTSFISDKDKDPLKSIDLGLLVSCVRQQIEGYSKLFHLCFDSVNILEKEWLYLIYQLQGLRKQDGLKSVASQPNHPKIKSMIDKTEQELEVVIQTIQKHTKFLELQKEKDKKRVLKGANAIHKEISDILIDSGLNKRYYLLWSIYSNYAHNEYVSDRQYNAMGQDRSSFINTLELLNKVLIILTIRLSNFMNERFESSKNSFDKEEKSTLSLFDSWVYFLKVTNTRANNN